MSEASIKAALADDGLMEIINTHSVEYLKEAIEADELQAQAMGDKWQ
jgi:hypothetical protein